MRRVPRVYGAAALRWAYGLQCKVKRAKGGPRPSPATHCNLQIQTAIHCGPQDGRLEGSTNLRLGPQGHVLHAASIRRR